MTSTKSGGRIIGIMLLLQLVGFILPFALLHPLTASDYYSTAAGYSFQIKAAVLLFFANGALTIAIAVKAWPKFRRYSEPMAMWLIILSVVMLVLQAIDNVHILAMLSLSQQYAEGGIPTEGVSALATVVRMTRRSAHYPELFAIDIWIMMFQLIVLRFGLVPRALAALAIVTMVVHFCAIPLPGFLGYGINTSFGVPMAFGLLSMAVWLMVKGFRDDGPHEDYNLHSTDKLK
ncbi:MAG TPA: DUF4386 domain-containing protein [Pyrinomonadaceae bacterium]|nr:DUF4386 domain-containing protein [Pyrinomonadaceae bacterium]